MPSTITPAALSVVEDEYSELCRRLSLSRVPLDVYVCDDSSSNTTAHGTPLRSCAAAYGGRTSRVLALPLADGDPEPTTQPFPPARWSKMAPEWPSWRIDLWHEVVHQYSDQRLGRWDPSEPGVNCFGARTEEGHGAGWCAAIQAVANLLGVTPQVLAALVDR